MRLLGGCLGCSKLPRTSDTGSSLVQTGRQQPSHAQIDATERCAAAPVERAHVDAAREPVPRADVIAASDPATRREFSAASEPATCSGRVDGPASACEAAGVSGGPDLTRTSAHRRSQEASPAGASESPASASNSAAASAAAPSSTLAEPGRRSRDVPRLEHLAVGCVPAIAGDTYDGPVAPTPLRPNSAAAEGHHAAAPDRAEEPSHAHPPPPAVEVKDESAAGSTVPPVAPEGVQPAAGVTPFSRENLPVWRDALAQASQAAHGGLVPSEPARRSRSVVERLMQNALLDRFNPADANTTNSYNVLTPSAGVDRLLTGNARLGQGTAGAVPAEPRSQSAASASDLDAPSAGDATEPGTLIGPPPSSTPPTPADDFLMDPNWLWGPSPPSDKDLQKPSWPPLTLSTSAPGAAEGRITRSQSGDTNVLDALMLSDVRGDLADFLVSAHAQSSVADGSVTASESPHVPVTQSSCSALSRFNAALESSVDSNDVASTSSQAKLDELLTPLEMHASEAAMDYCGAPLPDNERERLGHLCSLNLLDTSPEERYDHITSMLCSIFKVPFVLVSLVDANRQWFKSVVGLPGVTETCRADSFCAWTLLPKLPEVLVVMNTLNDPRFVNNGLVTGPPYIRFYAGAPLVSSNGMRLGSLCIIDRQPRWFSAEDCNLLCNFAELAVREIEVGQAMARRNLGSVSEQSESPLRSLRAWNVGTLCVKREENNKLKILYCNNRAAEILGKEVDELKGEDFWQLYTLKHPETNIPQLLDNLEDFAFTARGFNDDGRKIWIDVQARSGAFSQLDNDMPFIAVPVDLESEDGSKSCYWFFTVSEAASITGATSPDVTQPAEAVARGRTSSGGRAINRLLLVADPQHSGDVDRVAGGLDILSYGSPTRSSGNSDSKMHIKLKHVVSRCLHGGIKNALIGNTSCLVKVVCLGQFVDDSEQVPAVRESIRRMCQQANELETKGFLLPSTDINSSDCGLSDSQESNEGFSSGEQAKPCILVTQSQDALLGNLRHAIHENVFKLSATAEEQFEGVVRMDACKALAMSFQVASGLAALHQQGLFHGEVTDLSIMVLEGGVYGLRPVLFSQGMCSLLRPTLEQVVSVRNDYVLFFAPEYCPRALEDKLRDPSAAADVWAVGVIMLLLARFSLPMVHRSTLDVLRLAESGRLASDILEVESIDAPAEYKRIALSCLSPDPAKRPSAAALAGDLQALLIAAS